MIVHGQLKQAQFELVTESTKPSAVTFPYRIIFTTDTFKLYVSNGISWTELFNTTGLDITGSIKWMSTVDPEDAPAGYLPFVGNEYLKTDYPALYAYAVANQWAKDGSTNLFFIVPDVRGGFPRFLDDRTSGQLDPDNGSRTPFNPASDPKTPFSYQEDQNKAHTHTYDTWVDNSETYAFGPSAPRPNIPGVLTTNATGGNEARSKNFYLTPFIKY